MVFGMSGLDKLALVSKILLDQRVVELRKENETLKEENESLRLALFWREYDQRKLVDLMQDVNRSLPFRCMCVACLCVNRCSLDEWLPELQDEKCRFKKWFDTQLTECSLTAATGIPIGAERIVDMKHSIIPYTHYDVDTHFHHHTKDDWTVWTYGTKLLRVKTVDDPELLKLKRLFRRLIRIKYLATF